MIRFTQSLLVAVFVTFTTAYSCSQNGPTAPSVILTWVQSTTPGVTANCVYRGTVTGVYTMPALFCSTTATTTYTDLSVTRGTTYFYAVTAQVGKSESGYSNEVKAPVPVLAPPTGTNSQETKLVMPLPDRNRIYLSATVN
jgi:hypothetical protein